MDKQNKNRKSILKKINFTAYSTNFILDFTQSQIKLLLVDPSKNKEKEGGVLHRQKVTDHD